MESILILSGAFSLVCLGVWLLSLAYKNIRKH